MRVHRPVFINGMSRGGTTLLFNLIGSHPDVALAGETHKVFKGCRQNDAWWQVVFKCVLRDFPLWTLTGGDYFSPRLDRPRPAAGALLRRHIDRCLAAEKTRRHPHLNRDVAPGREYTRDELRSARLAAKNLDGAVFLNDLFREMYPTATFISLVRHGLAVCDGHVRRGVPAEVIGRRYQQLTTKMLDDAARHDNHLVVRFEDLLADPTAVAVRCFAAADLDVWRLGPVRLQRRKLLQPNGEHRVEGREWEVVWSPLTKLAERFDREIDSRQIKHLSAANEAAFLREAAEVMERLEYSPAHPVVRRAA